MWRSGCSIFSAHESMEWVHQCTGNVWRYLFYYSIAKKKTKRKKLIYVFGNGCCSRIFLNKLAYMYDEMLVPCCLHIYGYKMDGYARHRWLIQQKTLCISMNGFDRSISWTFRTRHHQTKTRRVSYFASKFAATPCAKKIIWKLLGRRGCQECQMECRWNTIFFRNWKCFQNIL